MSSPVQVTPVAGLPEIAGGDRLGNLIVAALRESGDELRPGDILSISQKAVSKAERRVVDLKEVDPTDVETAITTG